MPLDTLRGFIKGIQARLAAREKHEGKATFWNKPDKVSGDYETRMFRLGASRDRPSTDFYEFYWAHNMAGNSFGHFTGWFLKLFLTVPSNIPNRLRNIWWTFWALALLGVIALVVAALMQEQLLVLAAVPLVPVLVSFVLYLVKNRLVSVVGDAGRYLSPYPTNIEVRKTIRGRGLALLDALHKSSYNYERIIVVGHSLGSIIAYDILRLYWLECNRVHARPSLINQDLLESLSDNWGSEAIAAGSIDDFQDAQHACFTQQAGLGCPWRVSDLVTVGSPLNNLDYLALRNASFAEMVDGKEIPVCPPLPDSRGRKIYFHTKYDTPQGPRSIKVIHHAGMFALTRWDNIFFGSDFVGGPVQRLFGAGVRDTRIERKSPWFLPGGHTDYWHDKQAMDVVLKAMRLKKPKPVGE